MKQLITSLCCLLSVACFGQEGQHAFTTIMPAASPVALQFEPLDSIQYHDMAAGYVNRHTMTGAVTDSAHKIFSISTAGATHSFSYDDEGLAAGAYWSEYQGYYPALDLYLIKGVHVTSDYILGGSYLCDFAGKQIYVLPTNTDWGLEVPVSSKDNRFLLGWEWYAGSNHFVIIDLTADGVKMYDYAWQRGQEQAFMQIDGMVWLDNERFAFHTLRYEPQYGEPHKAVHEYWQVQLPEQVIAASPIQTTSLE